MDPGRSEPRDGMLRAHDLLSKDQGSVVLADWIRLTLERSRSPVPLADLVKDPSPGRWSAWQELVGLRYRGAETAIDGSIARDLTEADQYFPANSTCVAVKLAR